jgi:hypothetical protein
MNRSALFGADYPGLGEKKRFCRRASYSTIVVDSTIRYILYVSFYAKGSPISPGWSP